MRGFLVVDVMITSEASFYLHGFPPRGELGPNPQGDLCRLCPLGIIVHPFVHLKG
jgi:hypothetical protein